MEREEILSEIANLISDTERGFQNHSAELQKVYHDNKQRMCEAQPSWLSEEASTLRPLTGRDFKLASEYIACFSFIAANYHLMGETGKRDLAAESCANLVSGLGLPEIPVFKRVMESEWQWRSLVKDANATPVSTRGLKILGVILVVVVLLVLAFAL